MKTVVYSEVLERAAELASRTRDKIPPSEALMLQGFLAVELQMVWNKEAWPELVPPPWQASVTEGAFSKRERSLVPGYAAPPYDPENPEIGDVLGVFSGNPLASTRCRPLDFIEGDNVVRLPGSNVPAQVWVEFVLPRPDLMRLTGATLSAYGILGRFSNYLALRAAGWLLKADSQEASAGACYGLAEAALRAEMNRLPPAPWWRAAARLRKAQT